VLQLPPQSFDTHTLWLDVPADLSRPRARQEQNQATPLRIARPFGEPGNAKGSPDFAQGCDFAGALHAVEYAAIGILPLFAMCDRLDIGGVSTPAHPDTGLPQIFIYDAAPGGAGITEKGFALLPQLLAATREAIERCPCTAGCPSCIQSPKCGNNNEPLDKRGAIMLLEAIL